MTGPSEANLVDGEFVASTSGATIDVVDPANDETIGSVPAMTAADLERVIEAAVRGAAAWRATGALDRGRILLDAAARIRERVDELAALIVAENGKTLVEAKGEAGKAAEFFEYYGAMCRLPFGELIPDARPGTFAMQIREPLGPVLLVTPWNDPLITPARKMAPALAAGNSVVIKPATHTPLVVLRLAAILHEVGLPAGVLGTVTGRGSDLGDALTGDRRFKAVSFTGSTEVGLALQRSLAGTGVRVQTEMGGKNAAVVLEDADLDLAVPIILAGSYGQAGQRCTATSRLIVDRRIAPDLEARLTAAVEGIVVGPGTSPGVGMGPVISRGAQREIISMVERGLEEGARVVARPALPEGLAERGAFVEPMLLTVDRGNSLWRDEVFGPVVGMTIVDGIEQAIDAVNDSRYGLSSAVYTRSLDAAHRFIDGVETGQVSVNQPTSGWDVHEPFGGFKESGSPFKEQGLEALRFYSRVKTAAVRVR